MLRERWMSILLVCMMVSKVRGGRKGRCCLIGYRNIDELITTYVRGGNGGWLIQWLRGWRFVGLLWGWRWGWFPSTCKTPFHSTISNWRRNVDTCLPGQESRGGFLSPVGGFLSLLPLQLCSGENTNNYSSKLKTRTFLEARVSLLPSCSPPHPTIVHAPSALCFSSWSQNVISRH